MRKYIDNALIIDLILVVVIFIFSHYSFKNYIIISEKQSITNFISSLITVGATLLGFLLTIVTIIITFKKGFEGQKEEVVIDVDQVPQNSIFSRKISKVDHFYNTNIHKKAATVFVNSIYEILIVLVTLFLVQFNLERILDQFLTLITLSSFLIVLLTLLRSIYIFQLFLKVHLP